MFLQKKALNIDDIDENLVKKNLVSSSVSDIDLLIRTSGEMRISNFMLWQLAYSEFYFSDTLWPDFSPNELQTALINYSKRPRRFGSSFDQKNKIQSVEL